MQGDAPTGMVHASMVCVRIQLKLQRPVLPVRFHLRGRGLLRESMGQVLFLESVTRTRGVGRSTRRYSGLRPRATRWSLLRCLNRTRQTSTATYQS